MLALVPAALALFLYLPSLENPLVWDDEVHVPRMRTSPASVAFARENDGYRRPLVLLSYWAQSRLGCEGARCLHAVNVALHGLNGALLFSLILRVGAPTAVALPGTVLFSAHPLQWAAVAYVSGRTDLLAALFTLLALHAALSAARSRGMANGAADVALAAAFTATLLIAVACAALSKESGLLAGPLAAALWWSARRGYLEQREAGTAPTVSRATGWATLVAVALLTGMLALVVAPGQLADSAALGTAVRLRAAGKATFTYLSLLVMPSSPHLDRLSAVDGARDLIAGATLCTAMLLALIGYLRRPTCLRFALLALAIVWLPASNLMPIHPAIAERWVFTGEQLAYLPLAVLAPLIIAAAIASLRTLLARESAADRLVSAACAALVIAWSAPLLAAQRAMSDPEAVYRATLAQSPSPRACFNLGVTLLGRGAAEEAAAVYERCAAISPGDAAVYVQLGVAYQRLRDRNKAEFAYAKALAIDPADPYAWSNYASLDAFSGDYSQAREKWERALAIEPGFAPALEGLAKLKVVEERALSLRPPS